MKRIMPVCLLLILIFTGSVVRAQYVFVLRGDSVKITNCDSAELILENHTQGVKGFLYNRGNGRTEFRRGGVKLNDSLYLFGDDTLKLAAWNGSGTGGAGTAWLLPGNAGTSSAINFLGTQDSAALVFKTNNIERARFTGTDGNLLIKSTQTAPAIVLNSSAGSELARIHANAYGGVAFGLEAAKNAGSVNYVAIGRRSLGANGAGTTSVGDVAIGDAALTNLTTGSNNIAIGTGAMSATQTGYNNVAMGLLALAGNVSGGYNTAIGQSTLRDNVGTNNTAIGAEAGYRDTTGNSNIFLGGGAGAAASGDNNMYLGFDAASDFHGNGNVFLGYFAGGVYSNTLGDSNVYVGLRAGNYKGGIGDTYLGAAAGGGINTVPLNNSTAIGYGATVSTSNTMVFGNGNVTGYMFNSTASLPGTAVLVVGTNSTNGNGAYLTKGGVWTNASDYFKKENFQSLENEGMLAKIERLPISRWNYKGLSEQHIGPVAQDFHRIFDLGGDDKTISTIDPSGVALAGIQELYQKYKEAVELSAQQQKLVDEQALKIKELQDRMSAQDAAIAEQRLQINQLLQIVSKKGKK